MSTLQRRDESCPLCRPGGAAVLWQDECCRVILAGDTPDYPALCRVIWQEHVRELTDLTPENRSRLMRVVCTVEINLRELLRAEKINLAALGNQVPHLHWHVIPRFADDAHFPDPIWAAARRPGVARSVDASLLATRLRAVLGAGRADGASHGQSSG